MITLTPRVGLALVDGLIFLLILFLLYRMRRMKRRLEEFRPDRTVHHRLDVNTILTRVS